jgi:hypothetical protein
MAARDEDSDGSDSDGDGPPPANKKKQNNSSSSKQPPKGPPGTKKPPAPPGLMVPNIAHIEQLLSLDPGLPPFLIVQESPPSSSPPPPPENPSPGPVKPLGPMDGRTAAVKTAKQLRKNNSGNRNRFVYSEQHSFAGKPTPPRSTFEILFGSTRRGEDGKKKNKGGAAGKRRTTEGIKGGTGGWKTIGEDHPEADAVRKQLGRNAAVVRRRKTDDGHEEVMIERPKVDERKAKKVVKKKIEVKDDDEEVDEEEVAAAMQALEEKLKALMKRPLVL